MWYLPYMVACTVKMSSGYRRCVLQVGAHLRRRGEHPGEGLLVGPDDRVARVHDVEGHLAGVGVDQHLDRVADVVEGLVEAAARGQGAGVGVLGVGVVVGGGVGVLDPVDLPVEQHRIRVGVEAEERCRLGHPGLHAPVEHQPRLVGDLVGDDQVDVAEPDGEHGLVEEVGQLHPAVAGVVGLDVGPVGQLEVDLGLLGVGHHVAGVVEPEVDRRLGHRRAVRCWTPGARRPTANCGLPPSLVAVLAGETIIP